MPPTPARYTPDARRLAAELLRQFTHEQSLYHSLCADTYKFAGNALAEAEKRARVRREEFVAVLDALCAAEDGEQRRGAA